MENRSNEKTEKLHRLTAAGTALNKRFVGLDEFVDDLVRAVGSWYLTPELQARPQVVGVWGLTGTGKTAVLTALARELGMERYCIRINGGSDDAWEELRAFLHCLIVLPEIPPLMIILDEFQNARSLDDEGNDHSASKTRLLWDLLDNGTVSLMNRTTGLSLPNLVEFLNDARLCLELGVRVENNQVVEGVKTFLDIFQNEPAFFGDTTSPAFASRHNAALVLPFITDRFLTLERLLRHLGSLNGEEILAFFADVIKRGTPPPTVNLSKSIVFTVGNIDKLSPSAKSLNPDLDPDGLRKRFRKFDVVEVKTALKTRFRPEHLSRLGNTQLICPPPSTADYDRIIGDWLDDYGRRISKTLELGVRFDPSLVRFVRRNGLFPTQGVRSVLTYLQSTVAPFVARFVSECSLAGYTDQQVVVSAGSSHLKAELLSDGRAVKSTREKLRFGLQRRRRNRRDAKQACTAVHEAGHVVAQVVLFHRVPKMVYSVTADPGAQGYMLAAPPKIPSLQTIRKQVAVLLSGLAAERMAFGPDKATAGSEYDIRTATQYAARMFRDTGLVGPPASYQVADTTTLYHVHTVDRSQDRSIVSLLEDELARAEMILSDHRDFFLAIADYLADHPRIAGESIRRMALAHGIPVRPRKDSRVEFDYRAALKRTRGLAVLTCSPGLAEDKSEIA